MPETTVIFGPPGTGKTKTVIDIVEHEIANGVSPGRMAFVSFTRRAIGEAINRTTSRFGATEDDLPWFRTLHSAAFKAKGLRADCVLAQADYSAFGAVFGVTFSDESVDLDNPIQGAETVTTGDVLASIYMRARASQSDVETAIAEHHLSGGKIGAPLIRKFFSWYDAFKNDKDKIDFSDMLDGAPPVDVDVAIIDEAQDCTPQQWAAANAMFGGAQRWYVAGDDDQSIFRWAGASAASMAAIPGVRRILTQSMRVPVAAHCIAEQVIGRVTNRVGKQWRPRKDAGSVEFSTLSSWDPGPPIAGSWLVMARTRMSLRGVRSRLEQLGVPYIADGKSALARPSIAATLLYERLRRGASIGWPDFLILRRYISVGFNGVDDEVPESVIWNDLTWPSGVDGRNMNWLDAVAQRILRVPEHAASFVRRIRERGESLSAPPRVVVSTIHGAKGAEADNVFVLTDTSSSAVRAFQTDPDDEHRVFYVAVTRTKNRLVIAPPTKRTYYDL